LARVRKKKKTRRFLLKYLNTKERKKKNALTRRWRIVPCGVQKSTKKSKC